MSILADPDSGVTVELHESEAASPELLRSVHSPDYLERIEELSAKGGGQLDADTATNEHSYTAAVHAAGAAVQAARHATEGTASFAAVRPPGHHATADRAMGFCLINNVVVAARWAVEEAELARVLIVDWDVHHGNGTQAIVENDPRIRYVSLHQWPLYPGTGLREERGVGNIFNVPLPPLLPRERYVAELNAAVDAATDSWRPDLVLISAGFDALAGDPLAGFTLESEDYVGWIRRWRGLGAPIASVLEGGYLPHRIAHAAAGHLEALA